MKKPYIKIGVSHLALALILCLAIGSWQCKTAKQKKLEKYYSMFPDTNIQSLAFQQEIYNEAPKRRYDILHTRLELKFDIPNATVFGNAKITVKPYFYSTDQVVFDAVGFNINNVFMADKGVNNPLKYEYDGKAITIQLGKSYTSKDKLIIGIDYEAKPDANIQSGSAGILSDKGLYFINKNGAQPDFPVQVWSQGETQSNSKWFPTIDAPNERMTQEVFLTVDKKYTTLSNGLLLSQIENADGTRTDYWIQNLPAAPYLTMIAIGEYSVVKDKYKNIELSYYVEPKYAKYAKQIFGDTPEMMDYFSRLLGVEYAWEKYAQIAVREYVSGAMENTTATIHGDDIQRTDRELLDETGASVIAHELFHHWFGNLVTCESWSNLPLNESFANYSEYLWFAYKYGQDAADEHIFDDLTTYLNESEMKQVNLIRYDYNDREEMFDAHSYSKGGRVLHMLRNYVGDEAFFESLKLYLNNKRFNSAEIADLRLAFEEVTGEDLNWFFNQWFLSFGHPILNVSSSYNDTSKQVMICISQEQNTIGANNFILPLAVDIYHGSQKVRHKITIKNNFDTLYFDVKSRPNLVEFDAEHVLLGVINEEKTADEWIFQYKNSPTYFARRQAVLKLSATNGKPSYECLLIASKDKFYGIRLLAANGLFENFAKENNAQVKQVLMLLATKDEKSKVRANCLRNWMKLAEKDENVKEVLLKAIDDKAFSVQSVALELLYKIDPDFGFEFAKKFENETNNEMVTVIADIFSELGSDKESEFFVRNLNRISGFSKYDFIELYGKFLMGRSDEVINTGVKLLEREARNNNFWFIKLNAINKMTQLADLYEQREKDFKDKADKTAQYKVSVSQKESIRNLISEIKKSENNLNLINIYKN